MVLGLSKSVYFNWKKRQEQGMLEDKYCLRERENKVLPEEESAIINYALRHPKEGYRRLCWMMVDEEVAYVSPGTVYNILDRRDLLYRWKRSQSVGPMVTKPTKPNQRWHTDIMYLWINGRWYFFVGVIDGYSRYLIDWELLVSMRADEVTLVMQRALEKNPGLRPEIVNDNGTQFTGHEFKKLIKRFELAQIKTRLHHPESNGIMERFLRNLREGISENELKDLGRAREIIKEWVAYYNNERLHAGIKYLKPRDYYYGEPEKLLEARKEKIRLARERRKEINRQRQGGQNSPKESRAKSPILT